MITKEILEARYKEEIDDAKTYKEMAEESNDCIKPILCDMSKEEEIHAKHIKSIMDELFG